MQSKEDSKISQNKWIKIMVELNTEFCTKFVRKTTKYLIGMMPDKIKQLLIFKATIICKTLLRPTLAQENNKNRAVIFVTNG